MEAIATMAMEVVVKGTVILGLAWGVTLAAGKMSAAFRHWVWCGAFIALLVLPMVVAVMPVGGWRVMPGWTRENTKLKTQNAKLAVIENLTRPTQIAKPVHGDGFSAMTPAGKGIAVAPFAPMEVATGAARPIDWAAGGQWAWVVGVLAMLCPLAGAAIYLRVMERRGRAVTGSAWDFEKAKRLVGIRRRVVLVESDRVRMPLTFGIFFPRIVVPVESAGWDDRKRRLVLIHELAHVKRLDAGTHMVAAMVRAMWWFHPLAWLAFRQMGIERERACDDRVLAAGAEPAAYAETLVEIAAGLRGRFLIGGIAMARQSTLETRVRAVLDGKCNRKRLRVAGAMLAGLLVAAAVPLGALRAADEEIKATSSTPATPVAAQDKAHPVCKFPSGASVELLGIAHQPRTGPWWAADGSPVMPPVDVSQIEIGIGGGFGTGGGRSFGGGQAGGNGMRNPYHSFLFHFSNVPADAGKYLYDSAESNSLRTRSGELMVVASKGEGASFERTDALATVEVLPSASRESRSYIKVGIAEGKWEQAFAGAPGESGKSEKGQYVIGQATIVSGVADAQMGVAPPMDGVAPASPKSQIRITHGVDLTGKDWRFVAMGTDGKDHPGPVGVDGTAGNLQTDVAEFMDVPADQIKSVRLETRPIDWVEFKDLPMEPGDTAQLEHQGAGTGGTSTTAADDMVRAKLLARRAAEGAPASDAKPAPMDGQYYYLMGMVDRGGVYAMAPHGTSPLQAVAAAGVKSDYQELLMVRVLRNADGKQQEVLNEPFSVLLSDKAQQVNLQDGDVISVTADEKLKRLAISKLEDRAKALMDRAKSFPKRGGPDDKATPEEDDVGRELSIVNSRLDDLAKIQGQ